MDLKNQDYDDMDAIFPNLQFGISCILSISNLRKWHIGFLSPNPRGVLTFSRLFPPTKRWTERLPTFSAPRSSTLAKSPSALWGYASGIRSALVPLRAKWYRLKGPPSRQMESARFIWSQYVPTVAKNIHDR